MVPPTMQAVRYSVNGPPDVLHVESVPTPQPGPDEVLLKIEFAGVNPVDSHIRSELPFILRVPLPATPGKDGSGTVVAIGAHIKSFKVGDRVFTSNHTFRSAGTYAEYHVSKEEEVFHLPDSYSLEEGASIGAPQFTALRALLTSAKGKTGETLFVHGASGQVGIAAVQIAVAHGLTVYGTAGTEEGLQRVVENGAKAAFNHREENYLEKAKAVIGAKGPDIILEMTASTNLQKDLELIGKRGRIVVIGGRGMLPVNPTLIMAKEMIVTGTRLTDATAEEWAEMTKVMDDGLKKGWMKPTIGKIYPLADVVQAHHDIENPTSSQGRLLLKI